MATVVPLLEARGAKIIRYDKRPKDDALGNHVSRLADLLAAHGWAHASVAGAESKFSGGAASRKWEDLYFLGQSAGNQIIVRYLATVANMPREMQQALEESTRRGGKATA